jgi:hypothetical protein
MATEPTPEQSARHLLDVFAHAHHDKLRAGQVLSRGPAKVGFLKDCDWHIQDFVAGLQYASEHRWIRIPSPTVIRLTEDGLCAAQWIAGDHFLLRRSRPI